jgi:hypothetical protein
MVIYYIEEIYREVEKVEKEKEGMRVCELCWLCSA